MKSYHNIDKHPWNRGKYIGYTTEGAVTIKKGGTGWGPGWIAYGKPGTPAAKVWLSARTLGDMSWLLANRKPEQVYV